MDVADVSSDDEYDEDNYGNHGHSGALVLHTSGSLASQDSQMSQPRITRQESARVNAAIDRFAAMEAPGLSRKSSEEINREIAELTAYQNESASASASASDPPAFRISRQCQFVSYAAVLQ